MSTKTGKNWLDAIAAVFNHAIWEEHIGVASPVSEFRVYLRRKSRNQAGRAAAQRKAYPVEDLRALAALVQAAKEDGPRTHVAVLLLLDAGLRIGEAKALTWGQVRPGEGDSDPTRHLLIDRSCPRNEEIAGPTKSGRGSSPRRSSRA